MAARTPTAGRHVTVSSQRVQCPRPHTPAVDGGWYTYSEPQRPQY